VTRDLAYSQYVVRFGPPFVPINVCHPAEKRHVFRQPYRSFANHSQERETGGLKRCATLRLAGCRICCRRTVAPQGPSNRDGTITVCWNWCSLAVNRRENVPLYWGCARRAARAAGVLRAEICTPDLKLLPAQTALCWPRGNVGYKRSPHQSTTPWRETAWCSLPKSRLQVGRLEG